MLLNSVLNVLVTFHLPILCVSSATIQKIKLAYSEICEIIEFW